MDKILLLSAFEVFFRRKKQLVGTQTGRSDWQVVGRSNSQDQPTTPPLNAQEALNQALSERQAGLEAALEDVGANKCDYYIGSAEDGMLFPGLSPELKKIVRESLGLPEHISPPCD